MWTQGLNFRIPKLTAYCKKFEVERDLQKEDASFAFGEPIHKSCGILIERLPLLNNSFLEIPLSVVKIDVPLLVGLDIMRRHR